jgi:hypothetical protein
MPAPKHNIHLSTLALKSAPLRDYEFCTTELSAVEATLLVCDWNSYEGGMLMYSLVHHARVELLQMALELQPAAFVRALHSDFTRALVAVAFSKYQTQDSHKRILDWMLENVSDNTLRFMTDTFVNIKGSLKSLDKLAYENGFRESLHMLVERGAAAVDLLVCVEYGDLAMVKRELEKADGILADGDQRRRFIAAVDGESESFDDFMKVAEIVDDSFETLKALVQPNARWLEEYLKTKFPARDELAIEKVEEILQWSVDCGTRRAFGVVSLHFPKIIRTNWLLSEKARARCALLENCEDLKLYVEMIWLLYRQTVESGAMVGERRFMFRTQICPVTFPDDDQDIPSLIEDLTIADQ